MAEPLQNRVRALREARGLSQGVLAQRARLSRQSVSAIEAGRVTPAVDVALRLAQALDAPVEELFSPATAVDSVGAVAAAPPVAGRVALGHVRGRFVAHALDGDGIRVSADGLATARGGARLDVELVRAPAEVRENVLLMGCAAALGLLADRLNSRPGAGRFLWFSASSTAALEALAQGHTHVAGVHLVDTKTGEANVSDVRRFARGEPLVLLTLARWEAGLVTRKADAERLHAVADLGRRGVRLVTREPGAGARRLLERELRAAGVPVALAREAPLQASGHLEVARMVALGAADAGVATRDAALAWGLRFVPLAEERYDLTLPASLISDPRMQRLVDVLVSAAFRRELDALGYDTRPSGERVAEVRAR